MSKILVSLLCITHHLSFKMSSVRKISSFFQSSKKLKVTKDNEDATPNNLTIPKEIILIDESPLKSSTVLTTINNEIYESDAANTVDQSIFDSILSSRSNFSNVPETVEETPAIALSYNATKITGALDDSFLASLLHDLEDGWKSRLLKEVRKSYFNSLTTFLGKFFHDFTNY